MLTAAKQLKQYTKEMPIGVPMSAHKSALVAQKTPAPTQKKPTQKKPAAPHKKWRRRLRPRKPYLPRKTRSLALQHKRKPRKRRLRVQRSLSHKLRRSRRIKLLRHPK